MKKFLDIEGVKYIISKVIGKTDISGIGDGTLKGAISSIKSLVGEKSSELSREIDVERKRINNFTKLGEGSTTGDAELQDMRVGADGKIRKTAGEAVREQIGMLLKDLRQLKYLNYEWTDGKHLNGGVLTDNKNYSYTDYIRLPRNVSIEVNTYISANATISVFDEKKQLTAYYKNTSGETYGEFKKNIPPSDSERYIRFCCYTPKKNNTYVKATMNILGFLQKDEFDTKAVQGKRLRISDTSMLPDMDEAEINRISVITTKGIKNQPQNENGTLITLNNVTEDLGGQVQLYVTKNNDVFIRNKWDINGKVKFREWKNLSCLDYCDVSMFERVGVIGDSFASGVIFTGNETDNSQATHYNLSWPQIMGRQYGIEVINYSYGGARTKTFLTHATRGLPKLLSDIQSGNICNLYLLCLGINDSNRTTTGGTSYIGSKNDIKEDATKNPDTFWGNYGKIISQIKQDAPNSKIVMTTFCRKSSPDTKEGYTDFNNAIIEIAEWFKIPCLKLTEDGFFNSDYYMNGAANYHPTAPLYSGYSRAINRLLARCMIDNYDYFKDCI